MSGVLLEMERSLLVLLIILLGFCGVALLAEYIAPQSPYKINLSERLSPPDGNHLLGTDFLGRDILSRIIYGSRPVLYIIALNVAITGGISIPIGLYIGYLGGIVENIVLRITDIFLSFPSILLALSLSVLLGIGLENAIIAVSLSRIPGYIRLVRGQAIAAKERTYVTAVRALGASRLRIIFQHILPNIATPLTVVLILNGATAILSVAALGFLGLGAQPPTSEWGTMIMEARPYLRSAPHSVVAPGLCIVGIVFILNILGDKIKQHLDPLARRQLI